MASPSRSPSLEEPQITGIPGRPSPIEISKFIESTIRKHMLSALSPEDKAVMEQANRKLTLHATTGLWVGSLAGAVLAFRRRFMAGRAAAQAMKASGKGASGVPRLFYPQQGEAGANAAAGAAAGAAKGARFGFLARGLGLGILGALVGTQVGVWTGTSSAQSIIRASGHEERIARSLKTAMDRAEQEIRANSKGLRIGNELLRKSAGVGVESGKWGDEQGDFEDQEGREERNRDPDAEPLPSAGVMADSSSAPLSAPAIDSATTTSTSRWDELRRPRPSAPSTWDTVRERSSRSSVPEPSIERGDQAERMRPADDSAAVVKSGSAGQNVVDEKEERRRKFEEMMERERRGGDDAGGKETTWR